MMNNTINGRTPDEIKKSLNHCSEDGCKQCPYEYDCYMADGFSVLAGDAFAYIHQLERERDAAVETLILIANTDCMIPCESDELACSEYCENHCSFSIPQKECWMEYFRRRCVEVE